MMPTKHRSVARLIFTRLNHLARLRPRGRAVHALDIFSLRLDKSPSQRRSHGIRHSLYIRITHLIVALLGGGTGLRAQEPSTQRKTTPEPSRVTRPQESGPVLLQRGADGKPAAGAGQPGMLLRGPGGGPPPLLPETKLIPQPKDDKELAAAIKKLADTLAASGRFSGSILVAADGKPLVDGAWGEADREQRIANTPETAYDVG
jgi:hypothetical protein